jgi:c(7)-type cytochrome triheme protein
MTGTRTTRSLKVVLIFCAICTFAVACIQQTAKSPVPLTAVETAPLIPASTAAKVFKTFSHKVPEHKKFACDTCHQREGRSAQIELAGHESCIGCHLNQFIARDDQLMCTICHDNLKSDPPTQRAFPTRFAEGFNMKFDHAAHTRGAGQPREGCAACHKPSGPGQTIPVGIQTHSTCYACHTAESKIGTCNVCHQMAPYTRTLQSQYSFKAIFTHGDHRAVGCDECHKVVPGAPNARQVTHISILEHRAAPTNTCLQCHNGKRAFTGNDPFNVGSCVRCHKGPGFAKLPADTVLDQTDTPSP